MYSREFKEEVLTEVLSGVKKVDVAERHGIARITIDRWLQESDQIVQRENINLETVLRSKQTALDDVENAMNLLITEALPRCENPLDYVRVVQTLVRAAQVKARITGEIGGRNQEPQKADAREVFKELFRS